MLIRKAQKMDSTDPDPQYWLKLKLKVDWLAACIALKEVATVFVSFLWRRCTVCTAFQSIGSKGQYLKKCPKPY